MDKKKIIKKLKNMGVSLLLLLTIIPTNNLLLSANTNADITISHESDTVIKKNDSKQVINLFSRKKNDIFYTSMSSKMIKQTAWKESDEKKSETTENVDDEEKETVQNVTENNESLQEITSEELKEKLAEVTNESEVLKVTSLHNPETGKEDALSKPYWKVNLGGGLNIYFPTTYGDANEILEGIQEERLFGVRMDGTNPLNAISAFSYIGDYWDVPMLTAFGSDGVERPVYCNDGKLAYPPNGSYPSWDTIGAALGNAKPYVVSNLHMGYPTELEGGLVGGADDKQLGTGAAIWWNMSVYRGNSSLDWSDSRVAGSGGYSAYHEQSNAGHNMRFLVDKGSYLPAHKTLVNGKGEGETVHVTSSLETIDNKKYQVSEWYDVSEAGTLSFYVQEPLKMQRDNMTIYDAGDHTCEAGGKFRILNPDLLDDTVWNISTSTDIKKAGSVFGVVGGSYQSLSYGISGDPIGTPNISVQWEKRLGNVIIPKTHENMPTGHQYKYIDYQVDLYKQGSNSIISTKQIDDNSSSTSKVRFDDLEPGFYRAVETVKDKYILPIKNEVIFEILPGETITLNASQGFQNTYAVGDIEIEKDDNNGSLVTGAQFTLFTDEACKNVVKDINGKNVTMVTLEGKASYQDIPVGVYWLHELKPDGTSGTPTGYFGLDKPIKVEIKSATKRVVPTITNVIKEFEQYEIDKTVLLGTGAVIPGVDFEFEIYRSQDNALVDSGKTNSDGKFRTISLPQNRMVNGKEQKLTYYAKEINTGIYVELGKIELTGIKNPITNVTTVKIRNKLKKVQFKIYKNLLENTLGALPDGTEFTIYNNNDEVIGKGIVKGKFALTEIIYVDAITANMYFKETKASASAIPNNAKYLIPDIDVKKINDGDVIELNTEETAIINKPTVTKFTKVDVTGEDEVCGAKIELIDGKEVIAEGVSCEDDTTWTGLERGKEYTIRETLMPAGYQRPMFQEVDFVVNEDGTVTHVTMKNELTDLVYNKLEGTKDNPTGNYVTGALIGIKLINRPDMSSTVEDSTNNNTTENEETTVNNEYPDFSLDVTKTTPELTELFLNAKPGEIVYTFTTTGEEQSFRGIPVGFEIAFVELETPEGYEDAEDVTVTIPEQGTVIVNQFDDLTVVELPVTGLSVTNVLIGALLMTFGLLVFAIKKYMERKVKEIV